jgi:PadR family transcriptional regulator PadR
LSYAVVVKRKSDPAIVLGEFEQLVLTAVMLLGENAYGMTIHERVEELRPRTVVSIGAVYTTLDRLERKGLVRSWHSDPTPERGGRSKRFFVVEGAGERALRESLERAIGMASALGFAGGRA